MCALSIPLSSRQQIEKAMTERLSLIEIIDTMPFRSKIVCVSEGRLPGGSCSWRSFSSCQSGNGHAPERDDASATERATPSPGPPRR